MFRLLWLLVLLAALTACGSQVASQPTATAVSIAQSTSTPMPTRTRAPTVSPTHVAPPSAVARPQQDFGFDDNIEWKPALPTNTTVVTTEVVPVRVEIPSLEINQPILSVGLDTQRKPVVPDHDVGWYNLSAKPGQGENVVVWGHVLRFKATPNIPAPFAILKEVKDGAEVKVHMSDGSVHVYIIADRYHVTPDQVMHILPQGREILTMVSCIGDKVVVDGSVEMTERLVIIAEPK